MPVKDNKSKAFTTRREFFLFSGPRIGVFSPSVYITESERSVLLLATEEMQRAGSSTVSLAYSLRAISERTGVPARSAGRARKRVSELFGYSRTMENKHGGIHILNVVSALIKKRANGYKNGDWGHFLCPDTIREYGHNVALFQRLVQNKLIKMLGKKTDNDDLNHFSEKLIEELSYPVSETSVAAAFYIKMINAIRGRGLEVDTGAIEREMGRYCSREAARQARRDFIKATGSSERRVSRKKAGRAGVEYCGSTVLVKVAGIISPKRMHARIIAQTVPHMAPTMIQKADYLVDTGSNVHNYTESVHNNTKSVHNYTQNVQKPAVIHNTPPFSIRNRLAKSAHQVSLLNKPTVSVVGIPAGIDTPLILSFCKKTIVISVLFFRKKNSSAGFMAGKEPRTFAKVTEENKINVKDLLLNRIVKMSSSRNTKVIPAGFVAGREREAVAKVPEPKQVGVKDLLFKLNGVGDVSRRRSENHLSLQIKKGGRYKTAIKEVRKSKCRRERRLLAQVARRGGSDKQVRLARRAAAARKRDIDSAINAATKAYAKEAWAIITLSMLRRLLEEAAVDSAVSELTTGYESRKRIVWKNTHGTGYFRDAKAAFVKRASQISEDVFHEIIMTGESEGLMKYIDISLGLESRYSVHREGGLMRWKWAA